MNYGAASREVSNSKENKNVGAQIMPIEDTIRRYVLESFLFTDDETKLPDHASFLEEGIVDSTGILELVMFIEETFGIEVKDEEIIPENMDSVAQLAHYVRTRKEEVNVSQPLFAG
jgi:acyl carrier protein